MSFSSNGSMLAVGGPFDDGLVGATWVFHWDGSKYKQLGSKLLVDGSQGCPPQQGKE